MENEVVKILIDCKNQIMNDANEKFGCVGASESSRKNLINRIDKVIDNGNTT